MKRVAVAMALAAMVGCSKGEKPASMSADSSSMMRMGGDSAHMMMSDSQHMMMDTSKKAPAPKPK